MLSMYTHQELLPDASLPTQIALPFPSLLSSLLPANFSLSSFPFFLYQFKGHGGQSLTSRKEKKTPIREHCQMGHTQSVQRSTWNKPGVGPARGDLTLDQIRENHKSPSPSSGVKIGKARDLLGPTLTQLLVLLVSVLHSGMQYR